MSSSPLQKLSIAHLRGSVRPFHLNFEKGKKLTVVYGENATGKTTICDALEFLGLGTIGSLEGRGLGRTRGYWHSVGKSPGDVAVTLATSTASCTARLSNAGVIVDSEANKPKVSVLRRSQMLSLLEATAGQRYEAIRRFIDVSGIEASEASLRGLITELKRNRDIAVARVQENFDSVVQQWNAAGQPGTDPVFWAEQEAARDEVPLQQARRDLGSLRVAYSQLIGCPDNLANASAAVSTAQDALGSAQERMEQALQNAVEGAGEVVGILEAAQPYLVEHPSPEECPLCESPERTTLLRDRVEQRLAQFRELRDARQAVAIANASVQRAEHNHETLRAQLGRDLRAFQNALDPREWDESVEVPAIPAPTDPDDLRAWLSATEHLPETWERLETNWAALSQTIGTLRQALQTYRTNAQAQKDLDAMLPRLEQALAIVVEERREFTDAILKEIAAEVGRLYEQVHPGEGLETITLELDAARRASLEIGASFATLTNAPPQAYFSQSHLDTLGLCIFLALTARKGADDTILVLDDVLGSADEPHVDRTLKMLFAETMRFRHCIMTTHYGPWKFKLRWGWIGDGQCQFVELKPWSFDEGLQLVRSVPNDIDKLATLLAEDPPDPQLVCAKAGVILEVLLDFLTRQYECSVPRRHGDLYTLGDLLPAIGKKLRAALRVEKLNGTGTNGKPMSRSTDLGPILDEITRIVQARNVFGAHFNALAQQLPDADALAFGKLVLDLAQALVDPEAGWPLRDKSGSYWSTANDSRRLHPLKRPS